MNKENTMLALREVSGSKIRILVNDSNGSTVYRRAYSGIFMVDIDSIKPNKKENFYTFMIRDANGNTKEVRNYLTKDKFEALKQWPYIVTVYVNKVETTVNRITKEREQHICTNTPLGVNVFEAGTPLPLSTFVEGISPHILEADAKELGYTKVEHANEKSNNRVMAKHFLDLENDKIKEDVFNNYNSCEVKEASISNIEEDAMNGIVFDEGHSDEYRAYIKTLKKLRYIEQDENGLPVRIMKTTLPICRDSSKLSKLNLSVEEYMKQCYDKIKNDPNRVSNRFILAEAFNVHNILGIETFYDSCGGKHQLVYKAIDCNTFNLIDSNLIFIANGDIVDSSTKFIRRVKQ